MKTIETLVMDEEMTLSPSGVNPGSPQKAEDVATNGLESSNDNECGLKDVILDIDFLEEALDKQLASLEEEEEQTNERAEESVPKRTKEVVETAEELSIPMRTEESTETAEESVTKKTEEVAKIAEQVVPKRSKEMPVTPEETVSDETDMEIDKTVEVEQADSSVTEKMGEKTNTTSDSEEKFDDPMDNESQKDIAVNTEELKADSKGKYKIFGSKTVVKTYQLAQATNKAKDK
jgi:hypothetical protein